MTEPKQGLWTLPARVNELVDAGYTIDEAWAIAMPRQEEPRAVWIEPENRTLQ